MHAESPLPPGSRWLERATGRIVVVCRVDPGPWCRYEDDAAGDWWRCNIEDFFLWERFERLT